jgi:hypothetical protein
MRTRSVPVAAVFAVVLGTALAGQQRPVPVEPVGAIIDAFRAHRVVAICDPHGNQQLHDFLLRLVRDPRLPGVANDIIIEGANARYQELVDSFVQGEDVSVKDLRPVWQESTQVQFVVDPPLYTEILPAIRAVNSTLPEARRLRVLLGDPPIDWTKITDSNEHWEWIEQRDTFPADLIRREVLAKGRRALLVFGQMHFQRKNGAANFTSDGAAATIVSLLEDAGDTRLFTVWWAPDLEKRLPEAATWPVPSLTIVEGTTLGAERIGYDGPRFAVRNGQPDLANPIPKSEWRTLRAEEQYDALLYLGSRITVLNPSRELCSDAAYLQRRQGRLALVKAGAPVLNDFKRACAP